MPVTYSMVMETMSVGLSASDGVVGILAEKDPPA